jgi:RHS repeat-associated protein
MNSVADTSGEGPAHQITYGYDWRGVRLSRTETPTDAGSASRYFFYSPELQLLESTVDDSNNVWGQSAHHISATPLAANRDIIWFNGAPIAEIGPPRTPPDNTPLSTHRTFVTAMDATGTFWTFTDHLGTPLIQTDNTTAIVWRAEHEPYGSVWKMRAGARTDQPLRFPGQELAMTWEGGEENYNVFRWYRASFGKYTQPDPAGNSATNSFLYGNANPINWIDSLGQYSHPPGGPYHSPFPTGCKPEDPCNVLYFKYAELTKMIESHKQWGKANPNDPTDHTKEIWDLHNARNNCAALIKKNCTNKSCEFCKNAAAPSAKAIAGVIIWEIIKACVVPEFEPALP